MVHQHPFWDPGHLVLSPGVLDPELQDQQNSCRVLSVHNVVPNEAGWGASSLVGSLGVEESDCTGWTVDSGQ